MKRVFWIYLSFFFLIALSSIALPEEEERDDSSSCPSLGSISEYSEETKEAASEGFFHWQDDERTEAEPYLKKAAAKGDKGSMAKYAILLLNTYHLAASPHRAQDILLAADYMLRAGMRGDEDARAYIERLDNRAKQITTQNTGTEITSMGLFEVARQAGKMNVRKWLRGEFKSKRDYPKEIKAAGKLFFISVLPDFGTELRKTLEEQVVKKIRALAEDENKEENAPLLSGTNVVRIHGYAATTLGLNDKISEKPRNYDGHAQSSRTGPNNYAWYNTSHKYGYEMDVVARTLNCSEEANSELLPSDDSRLVQTQSEAYAAGPYYTGLRNWASNGREPKHLGNTTNFAVDSFYLGATSVFSGNPLWLIETTHMESPWQAVSGEVERKYGNQWPQTEGTYDPTNPESQKRERLKKMFNKKTTAYIQDGQARESLFYTLFLISAADKAHQAIQRSNGNSLTIDMRYVSKNEFCNLDFTHVETLSLKNASSSQSQWLKNLNLPNCRLISYSLDTRLSYKEFEKSLCRLRSKKGIQIKNLKGTTPAEKKKSPTASPKQRKRAKKDLPDYSTGDSITLNMSNYTQDSIQGVLQHLKVKKEVHILNVTSTNQTWILKALEENTSLSTETFSFTPKESKSGKTAKHPKQMEKFEKKLPKAMELEEETDKSKKTHRRDSSTHTSSEGSGTKHPKKKKKRESEA